jgi:hypothetical protein
MQCLARALLVASLLFAACTETNPGFGLDGALTIQDQGASEQPSIVTDSALPLPDGTPPDGSPPPPPADGFSCAPNSPMGCLNATKLLRCNPAGDGTLTEDCAPFLCNATFQRCNECKPKSDPYCVGDSVVSCGEDGLEQFTPCPDGCEAGQCKECVKQTYYLDADQDGFGDGQVSTEDCAPPQGYVGSSDDCDDADPKAHPGQQGFFPNPTSGSGTFDYNCDGVEEPEHSDLAACTKAPGGCAGHGWSNKVPDCGKWAAWSECIKTPMTPGCVPSLTLKQQRCR